MRKVFCLIFLAALAAGAAAADISASAPQGITLTVYDTGLALARDLRRVDLPRGEVSVRFAQLPRTIQPETLSFSPPPNVSGIDVREQQVVYDLDSLQSMMRRYESRLLTVTTPAGTESGVLQPMQDTSGAFALRKNDGSVSVIPADKVMAVTFPDAGTQAFLEPALLWRAVVSTEGPQGIRLSYGLSDLSWRAAYELIMEPGGTAGSLSGRAGILNRSGADFSDARVRLVATAGRGGADSAAALRYAYGWRHPSAGAAATFPAPTGSFDLPQPVTLKNNEEKFVTFCSAPSIPVSRFYVYDGVQFDRFQRNRRNDWNYGTEYQTVVDQRLEFENKEQYGLGFGLLPGVFRLYERRGDGSVDLAGENRMDEVPAEGKGSVLLGPARGLRGERERTGYSEVVPSRAYEETFEIRLENDTASEVEIRVVEHLYRWNNYEIVRADAEYTETAPQTIEFRPILKPGGRRAIHYTVRYSW
ncbi:MAG TPA: DUF4139 domain-containing protein [Kiritimatiellia bacterium]|nr:DUF4139 domain-containing protein [Kiritimatiellia bacterium]